MTDLTEEQRAQLWRDQQHSQTAAWLTNHRVTLAPQPGASVALRAQWLPVMLALIEAQMVEPIEAPFVTEFEDAPFPIPKQHNNLP